MRTFAPRLRLAGACVLLAGGTASGQVSLSGDVYDGNGGPLLGGVVYTANSFTVPAGKTLTVSPGAIVKLSGAVIVDGDLDAQGTALLPIRFTSKADDSAGGDTNGDGAATQPAPGDWMSLRFRAGATGTLDHVDLAWHGVASSPAGVAFTSPNTAVSIANSVIRDGGGDGVDFGAHATPSTLAACDLRDNAGLPMSRVHLATVPGISGCTASGNGAGDYARVDEAVLTGSTTVSTANTLGGVLVLNDQVFVDPGASLTLVAGLVVKFSAVRRITVDGTLNVAGTSADPVVITSFSDDAYGGDTNADGAATVPQPGDWQGIDFRAGSTGSVVTHAELAWHGASAASAIQLLAPGLDVTISNTRIRDGAWSGMNLDDNPTTSTFVDLQIDDNARYPVDNARLDALPGFSGGSCSGNGLGDYIRVTQGATAADLTITTDDTLGAPLGQWASFITVTPGTTLTVGDGVVIKVLAPSRRIIAQGSLVMLGTPDSPVVVTSIHDDTVGGDSNVNGAASLPAAKDWQGIDIRDTSPGSVLRNVVVRYGGGTSWPGVRTNSPFTELDRVRVEHGGHHGFHLLHAASAAGLVAFDCQDGFVLQQGNFSLRRSTAANCQFAGIWRDGPTFTGSVRGCVAAGNAIDWKDAVGMNVSYSFGLGVPGGGAGNLSLADPSFVDPSGGDLRLKPGSPCIDAGDPTDFTTGRDIGGYPRRQDGNLDGSRRMDMGAHEFGNLDLVVTGDAAPGGLLSIQLGAPVAFAQTFMIVGVGLAEVGTEFGTLFPDVSLPTLVLAWPSPPSTVAATVPATVPVPFPLVLQAVAISGLPGAPANTSNPAVLSIQ